MSQSFSFERFQKLAGSLFSLYILLLLVCSMVFLSPRGTFAAQATLSWDAPTTNSDGTPLTDLAGYKVYCGIASRTYSYKEDVFNVKTYPVNKLESVCITNPNTYYFAVKAYDTAKNESDYSNEVYATFHSLTINKSGSGIVTGLGIDCGSDCTELYIKGKVVTLSATPNSGSSFTGWSGGGCSGTGQCAITMNNNITVTATFSSPNTYTITASAGTGGSISPSGSVSVNRGTSPTFTITPNTGYHVANVVVDGSSAGAIRSHTFSNVTSNHTIGATFSIDTPSKEIIIDNRDATTSRTGTWSASLGVNSYGVDSVYSRDGSTFTWYFTPQQNGNYKVSMWWTYRDSRSKSVPVDINYSGGTARVFVNQTKNAGTWNVLGTYPFKAGVRYKVTITAQPSPASTCADAVKFAPVN